MAENKTSLTQKDPAAFLATVEHPVRRHRHIRIGSVIDTYLEWHEEQSSELGNCWSFMHNTPLTTYLSLRYANLG